MYFNQTGLIFHTNIHDAALRHLKSPEEQGVSTHVRTSQFFPCEDVFSSHCPYILTLQVSLTISDGDR